MSEQKYAKLVKIIRELYLVDYHVEMLQEQTVWDASERVVARLRKYQTRKTNLTTQLYNELRRIRIREQVEKNEQNIRSFCDANPHKVGDYDWR
jgi:hypothetical protein